MEPTDTPGTTLADDPILNAEVENAIAPYRDLLPPEMVDVLRATVLQAYTEHPCGQRILQGLREDAATTNASDTVPIVRPDEGRSGEAAALAPAAAAAGNPRRRMP